MHILPFAVPVFRCLKVVASDGNQRPRTGCQFLNKVAIANLATITVKLWLALYAVEGSTTTTERISI